MISDEKRGLDSIREAVDQLLYCNSTIKKTNARSSDKHRDTFIKLINSIEYIKTRSSLMLTDFDLDSIKYDNKFYDIIDTLLYLKYGKECSELIIFYLWERVDTYGKISPIINDDGSEIILQTPLDLWSFMLIIKPNLDKV